MQNTIIMAIIFVLYMIMRELAAYQERKQWAAERKDLYDRIMSKNIEEYKEYTQPIPVYEPVDNSEEAEYFRELEQMKKEQGYL